MARVLLLAGPGHSTWILANALAGAGHQLTVIIEAGEPRRAFLRRRLRKLGPVTVAGQLLFALWARLAAGRAEARRRAILAAAGLDETPLPAGRARSIGNANGAASLIDAAAPEAIVVSGTRILSRALLDAIRVPVLNIHAGITPAYRGVHGGYWALARGDRENCGVTVHLVDPGVDTGGIVAQTAISPDPEDSFHTYPALQFAAGVPLLLEAVRAAVAGRLVVRPAAGESRQYFHPTLWGYIATGLRRGVW